MTTRLLPVFVLLIVVGATACGDKYLFEAEKEISNAQWSYPDTLNFEVPVTDTTQLYNLYIHFTHSDTFPTQNIYLKLHTRFPDGKRVSRTRSFDLYDIEGKPAGKCSGNSCEAKILLQDNLFFNQMGNHLITLEQFSRNNPLTGIQSVGVFLEKTEKKR
jgi:gliding motility-associated lipoprotein GldH